MLVSMKRKADKAYHRRQRRREPQQRRARDTVEAVLDAVVRILKLGGIQAVTTNRVAEVAGVSIGSIYQYFPDKRAIFAALHERHIREIDRVVESKLMQHTESPLDTLMRAMIEAMIDAMIDAHTPDPELYELLSSEVPHRAEGRGISRFVFTARCFSALPGSHWPPPKRKSFRRCLPICTHDALGFVSGNLSPCFNGLREILRLECFFSCSHLISYDIF